MFIKEEVRSYIGCKLKCKRPLEISIPDEELFSKIEDEAASLNKFRVPADPTFASLDVTPAITLLVMYVSRSHFNSLYILYLIP